MQRIGKVGALRIPTHRVTNDLGCFDDGVLGLQ